jgi:mannobiose 2-epimerase
VNANLPTLTQLRQKAEADLIGNVLPFWHLRGFSDSGSLVGLVAHDLRVFPKVPQHAVLCARVLWTFAEALRITPDPRWRETGEKASRLLQTGFRDSESGGVYWSLGQDGKVLSDRKQVYAQAFTIYGLVSWWQATGDGTALEWAKELFSLLETHARDRKQGGYVEALSRTWGSLDDMRLSDKDLNAPKSYNTMLHLLEAYTVLLRATNEDGVREALRGLLVDFLEHIVSPVPFPHCDLFFERDWTSLVPKISYGHDIEASWLFWEAAVALGDEALLARTREVTLALADAVLSHGVDDDGGVLYEGLAEGPTNTDKHWWPQAEAVVGFLNAWQIGGKPEHRDAALRAWAFIDAHVIDHEKGEWFAILDRDGDVFPDYPTFADSGKIGPWKCPYHNGRMAMEVMKRVPAE